MIPEREQRAVRERLEQTLEGRVRIDYFTQKRSPIVVPGRAECRFCDDVLAALTDIAALHAKLTLTVHEFADAQAEAAKLGVKRVPCTVIRGQANRPLRYYGLPAGWQFANLIEALVLSSKPHVPVAREALIAVKKLREPVAVSIFVTPFCEPSQRVANAACRLALAHTNLRAEVVEIGEYPELQKRFDVRVTPTTVFDGRLIVRGEIDDTELARRALESVGMSLTRTIDARASTPFDPRLFDEQQQGGPAPTAAGPQLYVPGR